MPKRIAAAAAGSSAPRHHTVAETVGVHLTQVQRDEGLRSADPARHFRPAIVASVSGDMLVFNPQ